MNKKELIEKIKKLLSLAQSDNINESALAMSKAEALMFEYSISRDEVEEKNSEIVEDNDYIIYPAWQINLANKIAQLYGVKVVSRGLSRSKNNKAMFSYFGEPYAIEATKMTFEHLLESWQSLVKYDRKNYQGFDTSQFKKKHGEGFYLAIAERIDEILKARKESIENSGQTGLVLSKKDRIREFIAEKGIVLRKGRKQSYSINEANQLGQTRGKDIALGGGINTSNKTLRLG